MIILSLLPLLQAIIVTHHGVSQTLHFSEMFFLVVFGDKKVSWIPVSYIGIQLSWSVQTSKSHVTTRVLSMTEYKKCTQTSKIIPYLQNTLGGETYTSQGGKDEGETRLDTI